MALIKKPVNGMKDILPAEMRIRDYLIGLIKETYRSFGFTPIETPVVESLPNLLSKQGGDNEKLIFRVMKRGEKLKIEATSTEDDLADSGLRYDLTVPLVRYYSNNANDLPKPFKALQVGPVFRADRPQKGRFRQFYQCDIDIIGEPSNLAEIELISATTTLLGRIGFEGFKVVINDRRILKAMAARAGVNETDYDKVFIILDKMDKIGGEGVAAELAEAGYDKSVAETYLDMFDKLSRADKPLETLSELLQGVIEPGIIENLETIMSAALRGSAASFDLVFDPTLVRGMSYYTGPIFEIKIGDFGSSCGGGGRYDSMVGKFTGQETAACGFSIGFERIITILMEQGYQVPGESMKEAWLVEKAMPAERLAEIMETARAERQGGKQISVTVMAKNKKFQKEQLSSDGYDNIKEFYINPIQ